MRLLFDYGNAEFGSHPGDDSIGPRGYNMQRSFHAWLQTRISNLMHDASIELLVSTFNRHTLFPEINQIWELSQP